MHLRSRSRSRVLPALLALSSLAAGAPHLQASPEDPLAQAAQAIAEGAIPAGLELLERLFAAGYGSPADLYADPRFSPLREKAEARGPWRDLMGRHIRESRLTMAPPGEPGTPMLIRGRVVGFPGGAPVPGAVLELYHTDATGQYEPGKSIGRDAQSRLFCFVRTDAEGRFEVRTIKPAPYPGSGPGAAHVHYRIRAEGFRPYSQDFRPYDHPREAAERATAMERGERFSTVHTEGDLFVCEVTIPMSPLPVRENRP